jgi:hypothetical protein
MTTRLCLPAALAVRAATGCGGVGATAVEPSGDCTYYTGAWVAADSATVLECMVNQEACP